MKRFMNWFVMAALIAVIIPAAGLAQGRRNGVNERQQNQRQRILTDPHAPGRWRTNGPIANMPEFAAAFGCKPGDPMVRGDAVRASIW